MSASSFTRRRYSVSNIMLDLPVDRLKSMVGESRKSVESLTIEAGKVEKFARSLKNDNPAFRSEQAANEQGFKRVPAPITFLRTSLYPRYGPGDTETDEDRFTLGFDLGFDLRYRIHGQQEYELTRPLYVGDTLTGTTTLDDVSQREGPSGTLTIAVLETEYTDQDGVVVAIERKTILEIPGGIESNSTGEGGRSETSPTARDDRGRTTNAYPAVRSAGEVAVGDTGPAVVDTFDLKDFVRYAGASCGLDRIHYDRDFVREAGYPDAFAHGMLTAGVVEHMVTRWLGLSMISRFQTRFTSPLWPGDTLTASGEIVEKRESDDGATVEAALEGVNQHGEVVVEGEATAGLPSGQKSR